MGLVKELLYYSVHPNQLRSIIQWKVWHDPVHQRDVSREDPTLKRCFELLNMTSRSFSAVIQELHPDLLVPVALFYLALRALDTIEDDMTIPLEKKEPLLRNFHKVLEEDGWTFNDNGPNEKDRQLLVEFDTFVVEYKKVKPEFRAIIADITKQMGDGMADYANNAEHNEVGVNSIKDWELYCHYVAGLVGDGLTRLFVESGKANPALLERTDLTESMGQFLQKTNIIRDVHEDFVDNRKFWPREVWSKHVDKFEDLFDPNHQVAALNCSSELVLESLKHVPDCIFWMAGIKEQSVFNFAAIPQTMAIATLETVFRNPKIFSQNVKITKGEACQLMWESTQSLRVVCDVFRRYARKIAKKNDPRDPNYLHISAACGKIEQFIESIFPTQKLQDAERKLAGQRSLAQEKEAADSEEAKSDVFWLVLATTGTMLLISFLMIGIAYLAGARFDLAFNNISLGNFFPKASNALPSTTPEAHVEL